MGQKKLMPNFTYFSKAKQTTDHYWSDVDVFVPIISNSRSKNR